MSLRAETQISPRMTYNYRIKVEGLLAALASGVQIPEKSIAEVEHAGGGQTRNTKHFGKIKYGDLVIEKAMLHEDSDTWAYNWLNDVRDDEGGGDVLSARKTITIEHLADNGDRVVDRWEFVECVPKQISYSKNDALQDAERMMETITISIGAYTRG